MTGGNGPGNGTGDDGAPATGRVIQFPMHLADPDLMGSAEGPPEENFDRSLFSEQEITKAKQVFRRRRQIRSIPFARKTAALFPLTPASRWALRILQTAMAALLLWSVAGGDRIVLAVAATALVAAIPIIGGYALSKTDAALAAMPQELMGVALTDLRKEGFFPSPFVSLDDI